MPQYTPRDNPAVAGSKDIPLAATDRLYQRLAAQLLADIAGERYKVGDRLPAERDLAAEYHVSRPAVREAMIALEVRGIVEVRIGSGAYVRRLPGQNDRPGFDISAFELTEARLLFEGEAAALAAAQITDAELDELDRLVERMTVDNAGEGVSEEADRAFHQVIAKATRNAAIVQTIDHFWQLRSTSPACALLHEKARDAQVRPVVAEHAAIVAALRARDPAAARAAMRAHLSAVLDHLLFATEERAVAEARRSVASTRARFVRSTSL